MMYLETYKDHHTSNLHVPVDGWSDGFPLETSHFCLIRVYTGPQCYIEDITRVVISYEIYQTSMKGLGSHTGFFGPVFCPKVKHNLLTYQCFFLLFKYLCDSNIEKDEPKKNEGVFWHQIYGR